MRIFNANLSVIFLLERDKNWRRYSTNIQDGSKCIKIPHLEKKTGRALSSSSCSNLFGTGCVCRPLSSSRGCAEILSSSHHHDPHRHRLPNPAHITNDRQPQKRCTTNGPQGREWKSGARTTASTTGCVQWWQRQWRPSAPSHPLHHPLDIGDDHNSIARDHQHHDCNHHNEFSWAPGGAPACTVTAATTITNTTATATTWRWGFGGRPWPPCIIDTQGGSPTTLGW
jgi:hypothetical protein